MDHRHDHRRLGISNPAYSRMDAPDRRGNETIRNPGRMGSERASVWWHILYYYRSTHVSRPDGRYLSCGDRGQKEVNARRCRDLRFVLALCRFGLDVCVPVNLFAFYQTELIKEKI